MKYDKVQDCEYQFEDWGIVPKSTPTPAEQVSLVQNPADLNLGSAIYMRNNRCKYFYLEIV